MRVLSLVRLSSSKLCSTYLTGADGQTGSGKSYSMMGYGPDKGIIPLTCSELFVRVDEKTSRDPNLRFTVEVSYIEVGVRLSRLDHLPGNASLTAYLDLQRKGPRPPQSKEHGKPSRARTSQSGAIC